MRALLSVLLVIGLVASAGVSRADWGAGGFYQRSELEYWQGRYSKSTRRILVEGLFPVLGPDEYRRLANVKLEFPVRGEDLMEFYASAPPPTVTLPASSLKFLDDLCIAYAWLWAKGRRLEAVEDYVAMLKYKRVQDFPGGRYPSPLEALGIPPNAIDDPAVDDLSLRFFNSARAFILAHELGHLYYGHMSQGAAQSRRDEVQADEFALELMARTGTIPMGITLYFLTNAVLAPKAWEYSDPNEWARVSAERTHPLNSERLRAFARALDARAGRFVRNEADREPALEIIGFIAGGVDEFADYLADPDMQKAVAKTAQDTDVSALRR